jgi:uncharacterized protein (TIGR00369 family)
MENFSDNNLCFVCGTGNQQGLKLAFRYDKESDQVESGVRFPGHLQGWQGVVHGGLVSTVLDEIMIKAAAEKKLKCVTGEINVKFKKPTLTNHPYLIRGKVVEIRKRLIFTEGFLLDADGKIMAAAKGKLFTFE